MSVRASLNGLAMLAVLVAVGFLIRAMGLDSFLDVDWITDPPSVHGYAGGILFVALGGFWIALGLPRQAASFSAGYAFGFGVGALLGLLATMLGCVATFYFARLMGRSFVANRFSSKLRWLDDFLYDNPFTTTLLVRFLPFGSNLVTNLVAGISKVPALAFLGGSAIGFVPQTVVFALAGSGVEIDPVIRIGLSAVLLLASGAMGVALFQRYRKRHGARNLETVNP
jgi:uncharacterized membrane protein YdjX (TVP38/TMEM64 family)